MRSLPIFGTAAVVMSLMAAVSSGSAAVKDPPTCAALTFRPVPAGSKDGDQHVGLYKSRFGTIEVRATVESGEAKSYFVEVNGKRPTLAGAWPRSVETCAKAKRLGAVGNPPQACIGDSVAVLIDHTETQRYVLLYARHNGEWRFCSGGAT